MKGGKAEAAGSAPSYPKPGRAEDAYRLLAGYAFARRFVEGKAVADVCWEEVGPGTSLLAGSARSVVGLTGSPEAARVAGSAYAAPNVRYEAAMLPELPLPPKSQDVLVAFEVLEKLEWPGDLLAEAKRVLKEDGVLVVSTPDRQAFSNERNFRDPRHRREMYVPEFEEMLKKSFAHVRLYRVGAVAGGMVSKPDDGPAGLEVESAGLVLSDPLFRTDLPNADVVLAVCSDAELPGDGRPYLLLDRDRRLLHESEDGREDVELLKGEIRQMQETEVQAFYDVLNVRNSELAHLRAQVKRLEDRLNLVENSRGWRTLELLRRVRSGAKRLKRLG